MATIRTLALSALLLGGGVMAASAADTLDTANLNASGSDAQAVYSPADVGAARRAYRAECTRHQPAAQCECMTAGLAQALPPADVRLAARRLARQAGERRAPVYADADARAAAWARIQQVEADLAPVCAAAPPG